MTQTLDSIQVEDQQKWTMQQDLVSFKFSLTKLPKVEYFCTEVNIPGLQLGNATQLTSLRDIPLPGTKLDFGDLILTFLVDEKFENFEEIYTWLRSLGFPGEHGEYANLTAAAEIDFRLKVKTMKTQTQVEKVQQLLKVLLCQTPHYQSYLQKTM